MKGIELIAKERQEQIEKHGRTLKKDLIENKYGQLAVGAYHLQETTKGRFHRIPQDWDAGIWDHMLGKPYKERLIIAGALIAAEIDRLQSIED